MRTCCPVLIRWLGKRRVALVIGLLVLITSLAPLYQTRPLLPQLVIGPSIVSAQTVPPAQTPNRPLDALNEQMAEVMGHMVTCLPLGAAKTKLDIPLFIRCGEKFLSVVDSMVETSCGGPATELALALRYEAQELVASMVLMGLHGSVPSLSAQQNTQLVSAGSQLLLRLALLGKSRSLDVSALRGAQTAKSFSPQLRRGLEELSELGREYLFLDWTGAGDAVAPGNNQRRLDALSGRIFQVETLLGCSAQRYRERSVPHPDQLIPRVAAKLPLGSVLLEVVQARPVHQPNADPQQIAAAGFKQILSGLMMAKAGQRPRMGSFFPAEMWGPPRYIALMLFPDERVAAFDLGDASSVDQDLTQLHAAVSRSGATAQAAESAAQRAYRRVFQPLALSLVGIKRLYLSLDGYLHAVPFEVLHDGKGYLIDSYDFFYLNSGRDLLRPPSTVAAGPPLIVAAPFSPSTESTTGPGLYGAVLDLPALPFVEQEAHDIKQNLVAAQVLRGEHATESALRRRLQQGGGAPRVLHIAAHGAFYYEPAGRTAAGTRAGLELVDDSSSKPPTRTINISHSPTEDLFPSLSRAALLLSGRKVPRSAANMDDDGVLTALEVRMLDLRGTQLAVLSACQTGVGALQVGQGIWGLRQSFAVAGVDALVLSLWSVSDKVTAESMRLYYQELRSGTPRLSALHKSMRTIKKKHPMPWHWAPFIAVGAHDTPLTQ